MSCVLTGCSSSETKPNIHFFTQPNSVEQNPDFTYSSVEATEPPVSFESAESLNTFEESAETAVESYETPEAADTLIDEGLDTFYSEKFAAYAISSEDRKFTEKSIFVGDSICRGFAEYKVVHSENVYARGSVASRNFFDFDFFIGDEETDFVSVLDYAKPEFVFFSMGMNDVNLVDEDTYCENYRKVIDLTLENSDADVYVSAITPINSEFCTNYRIDCFNLKMQDYIENNFEERVHFVDFGKHLKDSDGKLREVFSGGDGIHLAPYAYYVALWEINRTLKADGLW